MYVWEVLVSSLLHQGLICDGSFSYLVVDLFRSEIETGVARVSGAVLPQPWWPQREALT